MRFFITLLPAAALFQTSIAGYVLQDDYMTDFFGGFDFFTGPDPTEGFVDYVDESTAQKTGLINTTSNSVVQWGVDTENKTPNGRPSVRITSKKSYDSGLIVLDVAHMPFGCGTWPAFWTVGPNWPHNGEIDILEGVNDQTNNAMTLHTGPGCQIGEDTTLFAGTVDSENCDVAAKGQSKNKGCSIEHPTRQSYGAGLNAIGGGVYATQWTDDAISIFYFPRDAIPEDVLGDSPDPSGWGKPAAKFTGGCDIAETFKKQQLVFDTTFCGQWAGSQSVWDASSCSKKASTCEEWVRDNPEAFKEAYWTINALKVYQDNGEAAPVSPAPTLSARSSAVQTVVPVPTSKSSSSVAVPAVSSQYAAPSAIPTSRAPIVPTTSNIALPPTSEVLIPSTSPAVAPAPTSETAPEEPIATPTLSATPLPSGQPAPQPPSQAPKPSDSLSSARPVRPTRPAGPQRPAPTGAGGMPGFNWPGSGSVSGSQPDNTPTASNSRAAALPSGTGAPSSAIVAPAPAQPSNPAPVVQIPAPSPTGDSAPVVTNIIPAVKTVYETVYATVTATPAPEKRKRDGRRERHVREHRMRLTRHHARV